MEEASSIAIPAELTAANNHHQIQSQLQQEYEQSMTVIARWTIFVLFALSYSVNCYASWRQYRLYKQHKERPAEIAELVPADRYAKHRRHKCAFLLFDMLYNFPCSMFICMVYLFSGFLFWLWKLSVNLVGQKSVLFIDSEILQVTVFFALMETSWIPIKYFAHMFNHVLLPTKWPSLEQFERQQTAAGLDSKKEPSLLKETLIELKQELIVICIFVPLTLTAFFYTIHLVGPDLFAVVIFGMPLLAIYAIVFARIFIWPLLRSKFATTKPELTLHECSLKRNLEQMCRDEGIQLEGKIVITEKARKNYYFIKDLKMKTNFVELDGGFFNGWFSRAKLLLDESLLSDQLLDEIYAHNGVEREKSLDLDFGMGKEEGKKKKTELIGSEKDVENGQKEEVTSMMMMMNLNESNEDELKMEEESKVKEKEEEDEVAKTEERVIKDEEKNHPKANVEEEEEEEKGNGRMVEENVVEDVDDEEKKQSTQLIHRLKGMRKGKRLGKVVPRHSPLIRYGKKDYDYDELHLTLNEEELLGKLAAEIGVFKELYTVQNWTLRKIAFLGTIAGMICLLHFTWRQPWFLGALQLPANEQQPLLLLGAMFSFCLFMMPLHKLLDGLVEAAKFWRHTHVEVASAIRLGRARQFRAALIKLGFECDYGLGDWLYCLLNPSERPECPPPMKLLAKHLEKEEERTSEENDV